MKKRDLIGCAFLILRLISAGLTVAATHYAFAQKNALLAIQLVLAAFWVEVIGVTAFNGRRH